jgi:maltooligosyltrehalose trehalohydrolase
LTAQWSDDFHHALYVSLTGDTSGYYADFESLAALGKVFENGFFHDGTHSSFRGRSHGNRIDTLRTPTWRLVVCSDNHDQIGNRATGDRLAETLGYERLAIGAVLVLAGPFTPMLFMGEEWGASTPWQFFTAHPEPELGKATAEGRIAEFEKMGWDPDVVPDPQDPATFAASKLDWNEKEKGDHSRLLDLYRKLATLRRTVPELTDPAFSQLSASFDDSERWLVVGRGRLSIVVNLSDQPRTVTIAAKSAVLLGTVDGIETEKLSVNLPANSAAILLAD